MLKSSLNFSFIVLCLFTFRAVAQEEIKSTYEQAEENLKSKNIDAALGYGLMGLGMSEEAGDKFYQIRFQYLLADGYLEAKDFEKSMLFYQRIISESRLENDKVNIANGEYSMANVFLAMGAYESAQEEYAKAYNSFISLQDDFGAEQALYSLGRSFILSENYARAAESFEIILDIQKGSKLKTFNKLYNELSLSLKETENYKALKVHAEVYLGLTTDTEIQSDLHKDLAVASRKLGDFAKALEYGQTALKSDPANIFKIEEVGKAYIQVKNFNGAFDIFNQGIELAGSSYAKAKAYNLLALAQYERNDFRAGLSYLAEAEKLAEAHQDKYLLIETYESSINAFNRKRMTKDVALYQDKLKKLQSELEQEKASLKAEHQVANRNALDLAQKVILRIAEEEKQKLSVQTQVLETTQEEQQVELLEKEKELQQQALGRQRLEAERIEQDLLITQQRLEAEQRKSQVSSLQREAQLRQLQEQESSRLLELAESEKLLLDQQTKLQQTEIKASEEAQKYFIIIVSVAGLAVIVLIVLMLRINSTRKVIGAQNDDLAKQRHELEESQIRLKKTLMKQVKAKRYLQKLNGDLKSTQSQLIHAEKMSSLGQLTAGIAHEVNNPVSFVKGGIQTLKMTIEEMINHLNEFNEIDRGADDLKERVGDLQELVDEDLEEFKDMSGQLIKDILFGAERIEEIVNGLRVFSRHDEAEAKNSNLHENLDSAMLILKSKLKNKADLVKYYDEDIHEIECFPGQLNQVFVNIIGNAADAFEKEGQIIVSTKDIGGKVYISIKDNGKGIPEDLRSKIFEPFFTTKDVGEGTGLGLSISYSIIKEHGGSIEVKSEVGKGTEFIIVLNKSLEAKKSPEEKPQQKAIQV